MAIKTRIAAASPQPTDNDDALFQATALPPITVKTAYVRDLEPSQSVTTFFLVQSKEIRFKKTGDPYLSLRLSDRSGQVDAKMWDGVEEVVHTFERDDFIKVRGVVQLYRDRPQMTIQKLRLADDSEVQIGDYLPHTEKNIDEMFDELRRTAAAIANPHLKQLLDAFLDDPEVASRFKVAPAAKSLHHASVGGLLEHVMSLLNLARLTASNYEFIDLDLLRTGVILHDLGKIHELHYDRSFGYTSEGQMLGHIVIVLRMIDQRCRQIPDFPPKWKTLVEHMILSHHGRYEFGSPKLPMFPEALMLSYLDDMDSKLESMRAAQAAESLGESEWTSYNFSLERTLLKKDRFLEERAEKPPKPPVDRPGGPADEWAPQPRAGASPRSGRAPEPHTPSLFGERLKSAIEGAPESE